MTWRGLWGRQRTAGGRATRCAVVVCCRSLPKQKAEIVRLVKEGIGAQTLAIRDGANNLLMIQTADIAVGVSGKEGMQAVNSSDYAIAKFKFLSKLLFVHGHWSYNRNACMISNFFYKEIIGIVALWLYQFWCAYSTSILLTERYWDAKHDNLNSQHVWAEFYISKLKRHLWKSEAEEDLLADCLRLCIPLGLLNNTPQKPQHSTSSTRVADHNQTKTQKCTRFDFIGFHKPFPYAIRRMKWSLQPGSPLEINTTPCVPPNIGLTYGYHIVRPTDNQQQLKSSRRRSQSVPDFQRVHYHSSSSPNLMNNTTVFLRGPHASGISH
ncbi:hypothetical protein PCANC_27768 [Puccinia coronata f. sp. avenae]|uniref:P-type ATPase C-terminal domain-containing protein n=1 Tax=Puccinia coronata f. sp. avenae TaxID=200324 RepID=A0A2N5TNG5_9BASI|nr:hypothetical protein PCANC_27768 [Puccinia coronata f. sp. avenae]